MSLSALSKKVKSKIATKSKKLIAKRVKGEMENETTRQLEVFTKNLGV